MHATWTLLAPLPDPGSALSGLVRARCHGEILQLSDAAGRQRRFAVHDEQQRPLQLAAARVAGARIWLLASREEHEVPLLLTGSLPSTSTLHEGLQIVQLQDPATAGCGALLDQRWGSGVLVLAREAAKEGQPIEGNELQAWSLEGELLWRVFGRDLEGLGWIDRFADNLPPDTMVLSCSPARERARGPLAVLAAAWPEHLQAPTSWRRETALESAIAAELPHTLLGSHLSIGERDHTWLYATTQREDDQGGSIYHLLHLRQEAAAVTLEAHASGPGFVFGLWRSPDARYWVGLGSEGTNAQWEQRLGILDAALAFTLDSELPQSEVVHEVALSWFELAQSSDD